MTPVRMSELIATIPEELKHKKLLFILGKDLMGRPVYCEMDKMPHLLIAGATGSGKSVCVNGLICTILLRTTPDEVKVLLIDPKKVEFTQYRNIPHLIGPVISDSNDASRALKVIVDYMENRYEVFSKVGVRNINTYNDYLKSHPEEKLKQMPRIVVIIDELADLMSTVGKDVEQSIQRITQLARAAGIHLIVATQRPSTDVITGIIKANIPSRIAFAVSSGIDSRTIIDTVGAERLLGNGDMLYWPIGEPTSIRLQGVYVTDDEVNRIADFTSKQMKPMFDDAFIRLQELDKDPDGLMNDYSADPLFEEVVEYIREAQKASTSLLQRKFGIGYNRAARLIDVLEQRGMIGPAQGSKPREVFLEKVE
ncbi:DNA translocase SpoIIIE [bioreactor metagenome]|uniref:DNA translocase SpoIIIE n=1 Tax=bioreactor metagenome TaxID=1076179 RepID=A0A645A8Z7_9ZZZZ